MTYRKVEVRWPAAIIVTVLLLTISGCRNLVVNPPTGSQGISDFERAWTIADSIYPFFQFKHINWDSVHSVYEPIAQKANGDEIFNVLSNMFAGLKDAHLEIITQGGYAVPVYLAPRSERDIPTFSPQITRNYFSNELKLAGEGCMDYGILPENIGYVRISTFSSGNWIQDFDGVLHYLDSTKCLIVDVRQNTGGNGNQVNYIVSRFLSAPLPSYPAYFKGQLVSYPPIQPSGSFRYKKPVVVLINGVSFSATELFATMMSQLPNVTLVGDTTGGGGGGQAFYTLPSGRQIRISIEDFRRYDDQPIEWNGVPPNIVVMQTAEDLQNAHDLQLERAIELLQ